MPRTLWDRMAETADRMAGQGASSTEIRKAIYDTYGVMIGAGGSGNQPDFPTCAICGANGGGGHGGMCPEIKS